VLAAIILLCALPAAIAALRRSEARASPAALLEAVVSSGTVGYEGYAESNAGLRLPEVPNAGRVLDLLAERVRMRVWWRSPGAWRVDELSVIGERDAYRDRSGLWVWDSEHRAATRIEGIPTVRFPRASDLLPPELGRRLAAAARPSEASRLPSRVVAGIGAAGMRLTPSTSDTTIKHVDMWVDPDSGLPLSVEITPRKSDAPIITSAFLDLNLGPPDPEVVRFRPPTDASVNFTDAADFAQAVDRYSPFVLPEEIEGRPLLSSVAGAAGTYGDGFGRIAVLALPERHSPFDGDEMTRIPTSIGPWGTAHVVETPLLTGMTFERNGITYVLGGTVPIDALEEIAVFLARRGVGQRL
jgi:outer membrane lipoprotein-sorting protein